MVLLDVWFEVVVHLGLRNGSLSSGQFDRDEMPLVLSIEVLIEGKVKHGALLYYNKESIYRLHCYSESYSVKIPKRDL